MKKRDKIILIGGLVGAIIGVIVGLTVARRGSEPNARSARPDGKKLWRLGMSLMGLVRLIQEL